MYYFRKGAKWISKDFKETHELTACFVALVFLLFRERTLTAQTIISLEVPQGNREEETEPLPDTSFSHNSHSYEGIMDNA